MDLTSRLRGIVSSTPRRELTYEPDDGYRQAAPVDLDRVADALSGRRVSNRFGECLVIDRRYDADRRHGAVRIGDCAVENLESLRLLDPALRIAGLPSTPLGPAKACAAGTPDTGSAGLQACHATPPRTIFIDLETTGLSGGAGTLAFLVGCGYFDLDAFHVRQFLLPGHSSERALLAAVAEFLDSSDLIVTYNGKTFDVPVMETRWTFHRLEMPAIGGDNGVPHFDMLHPARRLWKRNTAEAASDDHGGCRLSTLERTLFEVERVGDVPGFDIPARFFGFVRSGDPCPLEPVLEHNRIDLVSLAAVMRQAVHLVEQGPEACRDSAEALALGKVYERAEQFGRAEACYRRAAASSNPFTRSDALYRLAVRLRRDRRFTEAADVWRELMELTEPRAMRRGMLGDLRQVAAEALAIHHEHRAKDLAGARELALASLEHCAGREGDGVRHRLARLERKLSRQQGTQLFT